MVIEVFQAVEKLPESWQVELQEAIDAASKAENEGHTLITDIRSIEEIASLEELKGPLEIQQTAANKAKEKAEEIQKVADTIVKGLEANPEYIAAIKATDDLKAKRLKVRDVTERKLERQRSNPLANAKAQQISAEQDKLEAEQAVKDTEGKISKLKELIQAEEEKIRGKEEELTASRKSLANIAPSISNAEALVNQANKTLKDIKREGKPDRIKEAQSFYNDRTLELAELRKIAKPHIEKITAVEKEIATHKQEITALKSGKEDEDGNKAQSEAELDAELKAKKTVLEQREEALKSVNKRVEQEQEENNNINAAKTKATIDAEDAQKRVDEAKSADKIAEIKAAKRKLESINKAVLNIQRNIRRIEDSGTAITERIAKINQDAENARIEENAAAAAAAAQLARDQARARLQTEAKRMANVRKWSPWAMGVGVIAMIAALAIKQRAMTSLHRAAGTCDVETVNNLLATSNYDVNYVNAKNFWYGTPIASAVKASNTPVMLDACEDTITALLNANAKLPGYNAHQVNDHTREVILMHPTGILSEVLDGNVRAVEEYINKGGRVDITYNDSTSSSLVVAALFSIRHHADYRDQEGRNVTKDIENRYKILRLF